MEHQSAGAVLLLAKPGDASWGVDGDPRDQRQPLQDPWAGVHLSLACTVQQPLHGVGMPRGCTVSTEMCLWRDRMLKGFWTNTWIVLSVGDFFFVSKHILMFVWSSSNNADCYGAL